MAYSQRPTEFPSNKFKRWSSKRWVAWNPWFTCSGSCIQNIKDQFTTGRQSLWAEVETALVALEADVAKRHVEGVTFEVTSQGEEDGVSLAVEALGFVKKTEKEVAAGNTARAKSRKRKEAERKKTEEEEKKLFEDLRKKYGKGK